MRAARRRRQANLLQAETPGGPYPLELAARGARYPNEGAVTVCTVEPVEGEGGGKAAPWSPLADAGVRARASGGVAAFRPAHCGDSTGVPLVGCALPLPDQGWERYARTDQSVADEQASELSRSTAPAEHIADWC